MQPTQQKGKLTTWKDDRGFGFIKPDRGGKEVFLHISALKRATRRPQVGDIILYEEMTETNGKLRATRAFIQGAIAQPLPSKKKTQKRKLGFLETILTGLVIVAIALITAQFRPSQSPPAITSATNPNCVIKGNISQETGNKLYHLPGMEDYEATVIDQANGERWFCSESEAIANGWQKAPR